MMRVKIVKTVTVIALVVWLLSVCCIDSESRIPFITCGVSLLWLLLVTIANIPRSDK